jgi:hypothetical protein
LLRSEERLLLIVNCLAEHGNKDLRRLYHFIERAGVDVARRFLRAQYRFIFVLRDSDATWPKIVEALSTLSNTEGVKNVDLFFQLHGEPGRMRFHDRWVSVSELSRDLGPSVDKSRLHLVYNLCCYGDSHSAAFLKAGFKAAIGARKVNANAATEYPLFCRFWAASSGKGRKSITVSEIIRRADRPFPRFLQDLIARRYFNNVDSTKVISGNASITI